MKLVVVGGVAGGASAAARVRRLDAKAEIVMFERGRHVSFSNCALRQRGSTPLVLEIRHPHFGVLIQFVIVRHPLKHLIL